MKKYLFYTLLLVALFIGINATTTFAEETGDLTVKIKPQENYGVYHVQALGFTIKISRDGEPVTGTFPLESVGTTLAGRDSFNITSDSTPINFCVSDDIYYPDEVSFTIKDIPLGATYEIIPDNKTPLTSYDVTSFVEYSTTDSQKGEISDAGNIVNYTLRPKSTKIVITYKDTAPDYDTPDIAFYLWLHSNSLIPDTIHYYNSSNPNEKFELEKNDNNFKNESITLKKGESIIIDDAPIGIAYFITPTQGSIVSPYVVSYNQTQSGTIYGPKGIEYYYSANVSDSPSKLTIIKIPSGKGIDMTKEFTFKLTGSAYQPDGSYKNLNSTYLYNVVAFPSGELIETRETTFNDGVAYVKCKANQKIEIGSVEDLREVTFESGHIPKIDFANKLYELTKFEIEEIDCNDYTSPIRFPARLNSLPSNFYIPNSRKFTGTLTLKKEITEDVPEDQEFTFKIKLIDGATDLPTEYEYTGSKEGTLVFEEGVATITLKANESITITGLPLNSTYEIEEEADEYDVSYDSQVGKITEETSVTVTNSVKTEEPVEPEEPEVPEEETPTEENQEEKNEEVVEEKKEISDPRTGDNIVISAVIGLISFISVLAIAKKVKRN